MLLDKLLSSSSNSGPPPEDPTQNAQDIVDVGSAELALSANEVEEWLVTRI